MLNIYLWKLFFGLHSFYSYRVENSVSVGNNFTFVGKKTRCCTVTHAGFGRRVRDQGMLARSGGDRLLKQRLLLAMIRAGLSETPRSVKPRPKPRHHDLDLHPERHPDDDDTESTERFVLFVLRYLIHVECSAKMSQSVRVA